MDTGLPLHLSLPRGSHYHVQVYGRQMKEVESSVSIIKRDGPGDPRVERSSLLSMASTTTWGHSKVPDLAAMKGHVWVHGYPVAGVSVDV